jgi:tape measure domain-containing protein
MAVQIGSLYFSVSANTSSAQSSISGLGSAASAAGSLITSALTTAFDAVSYAAKTATALVVKEVIGMGAAFNIASQQATGLFTALTGSAQEAQDIMREFAEISIDQPIFDAATLQKTTSLLLTFQVAKDDALELAKNISLAAVALGKGQLGATQLARAIGQIQGRGWLEGDEARQLSEVGINAYAVMADALGVTVAKAQELGRTHQLLAEDVIPALNAHLSETFGPVAQTMLNTYSVQAQGIRNIITGIGSALVDPFIGKTGGGVLVEFLSDVRSELTGVISVAEDGSYELTGALAPLTAIAEAAAEGFTIMGDAFIEFLRSAEGSDAISGFASGIAAALPAIAEGLVAAAEGTFDFVSGLVDAIQPIIPPIQELFARIGGFVVEVLPELARGFTAFVDAAAPVAAIAVGIANNLIQIASPVIVSLISAIADAFELLAENMELLIGITESLAAVWLAFKIGVIAVEVATASFVSVAVSPLIAGLAGIAAQAGLALLALGALQGVSRGLKGDTAWLYEDRPIWEKPFQAIGALAFEAFGGDREATEQVASFEAGREAAASFNLALLDSADSYVEAREMAEEYAVSIGLTGNQVSDFANVTSLAWNRVREDTKAAKEEAIDAARGIDAFTDLFAQSIEDAAGSMTILTGLGPVFKESIVPAIEDATDYIKLLEGAAKSAWEEVDRLLQPSADATIDEFLASLPAIVEDLTEALKEPNEILRDLEVGSVLGDVTKSAGKLIADLAKNYGLSLGEIKDLIGKQGLTAVLEALGDTTEATTKAVDPLIVAYGKLGYSLDIVKTAVGNLNERRTNGLKAQIDAVTSALDGAKEAAKEAREAFDEYFLGGSGGLQGAIDKVTLDIPSVGDDVEAGLIKGGPQGEAAVRQALGGLGSSLGEIFQLGLEQGLSPEQIIELLQPVYGSISQELSGALNRITTLDWEEGFTPAAAQSIRDWMAGILDPAQIGAQFNAVTAAEGMVTGLQAQLDQLNAALNVDVVFSSAQVQAEIDKMTLETEVTTELSDEAATILEDEIMRILEDADLAVGIDQAQITSDILDAAREAQDRLTLEFNSELVFDDEVLKGMADFVGGEFARIFNDKLVEVFAPKVSKPFQTPDMLERAQSSLGGISSSSTSSVTVNNDIKVSNPNPIASASEVVAASSAAAGSGGRYTLLGGRTLNETYGSAQ